MKSKRIATALAALSGLLLASCASRVNEAIVHGLLLDADTNSVTVLTQSGDTLNVTTQYTHPDSISGAILVGDSVIMTYSSSMSSYPYQAQSIQLNPSTPRVLIVGSWVEPVVDNPAMVQGFALEEGGVARTINLADMVFVNWQIEGDHLYLRTQEISGDVMVEEWDTLQISTLTDDSLQLAVDELVMWRLGRAK